MQITGENKCFICYSVSDCAFAAALANNLNGENFNVYFHQKESETGTNKNSQDALAHCSCVIVVLSPFAKIDRQVTNQITFALEHKKKIVTVLAEHYSVTGPLKKTKTFDFSKNYRKGLSELTALLNKYVKAGTLPGIKHATANPVTPKRDYFKSVLSRINVFKK